MKNMCFQRQFYVSDPFEKGGHKTSIKHFEYLVTFNVFRIQI